MYSLFSSACHNPLHATVHGTSLLPAYAVNHMLLRREEKA